MEKPTVTPLGERDATSILYRINDGLVVFDRKMNYLFVNPRAAELLGRTSEELVGKNYWNEYPEAKGSPFAEAYLRALATLQSEVIEAEYQPWGRWFENRIYPSPEGLTVLFTEITQRKQAEAALRESEERLRLAVQVSNVGLWDWDIPTNRVRYSRQWKNQLGYEEHQVGSTFDEWHDRVHPDDRAQALERVQRYLLRPAGSYESEFRMRHKNGTWRWIYARGEAFLDATGAAARMLGCHLDITERKQAELLLNLELRVVEEISRGAALEPILETIVLGIESFTQDAIASVLLLDAEGRRIHTAAAPHLPEEYNRAIEGAEIGPVAGSCGTAAFRGEPVIVTDIDTDPLWEAYRGLVQSHGLRACWSIPVKNQAGKILATFAVYYREPRAPSDADLAFIKRAAKLVQIAIERKQVKQALQEEEEKFRQLTENIREVLWMTDPSKETMLYVSPGYEEIWGRTRESLYANPANWMNAIHADDRERIREAALHRQISGEYDEEYRIVKPDGSIRWIWDRAFPVARPDGTVSRIAGIAEDITGRKNAEEALRESEGKFREVFESANAGKSITQINGEITPNTAFANLLGYNKVELAQKTWQDLTPPEEIPSIERILSALLKGDQESARFTKRYIRKDGSHVWADVSVAVRRDAQHHPSYFITTIVDITERVRAEEKLQRSEHVLRLFVEHSPAAIAMFDNRMNYIVASQRYLKDYDLGDQQLEGRSHYDVFPEIPKRWKEVHQRCLAGAVEKAEEDAFQRKNGKMDWVRWEMRPWYEVGGFIGGVILFSDVVTERKQIEDRLRESEERYRNLLERAPVGIAVHSEGKIVFTNRAGAHMLGAASEEQLIGKSIVEIIHPDRLSDAQERIRKMLAGEQGLYPVEDLYRKLDGTPIHVEVTATPLHYNGKTAVQVIVTDITDRKKAMDALAGSEARHRAFFEHSMDAILLTSPDGTIHAANPAACQMLGRTEEEIRLAGREGLVDSTDPRFPNLLSERTRTGKARGEITMLRRDSTPFPVEVSAALFQDSEGNTRSNMIIRDVTERNRTETALRQSTEQLRNLAAHLNSLREDERRRIAREVHDDLGQFLSALKMDIAMLERHFLKRIAPRERHTFQKELRGMISLVDSGIRSVRRIIRDLRPEPLDSLTIGEALQWLAADFEHHTGVKCIFALSPSELRLPDKLSTALFRVFQEALQNITKHANAVLVQASIRKIANRIELKVSDDGIGMDVTVGFTGKTFGLLGMRERISALGGSVSINSTLGSGTTLLVQLPVEEVH